MKDLIIGQVLSLRIRIDYYGVFPDKHPYLILDIRNGIEKYRRQKDTLSSNKLGEVIKAYKEFHAKNEIPESRIVYLDKDEIEKLNQ